VASWVSRLKPWHLPRTVGPMSKRLGGAWSLSTRTAVISPAFFGAQLILHNIHRRTYDQGNRHPRKSRETRAMLGSRFKILLADAGLTPESAGKLLHVTPRTVRNWISGRVTVPYSAYKLVRVMRLFELPCEGWDGWHMHSGKLWTPEGFGFTPDCQGWWSLLVRQARLFRQVYDRDRQLDIALQRASEGLARTTATPSAIGRRPAPGAGGAAARP
jgi:DNA-binding transcriptional regulator YiaG